MSQSALLAMSVWQMSLLLTFALCVMSHFSIVSNFVGTLLFSLVAALVLFTCCAVILVVLVAYMPGCAALATVFGRSFAFFDPELACTFLLACGVGVMLACSVLNFVCSVLNFSLLRFRAYGARVILSVISQMGNTLRLFGVPSSMCTELACATCNDRVFQVFVKLVEGNTITIDVAGNHTGLMLKRAICAKSRKPIDGMRVMCGGRDISDAASLDSYGVEKESSLFEIYTLPGGSRQPGLPFRVPNSSMPRQQPRVPPPRVLQPILLSFSCGSAGNPGSFSARMDNLESFSGKQYVVEVFSLQPSATSRDVLDAAVKEIANSVDVAVHQKSRNARTLVFTNQHEAYDVAYSSVLRDPSGRKPGIGFAYCGHKGSGRFVARQPIPTGRGEQASIGSSFQLAFDPALGVTVTEVFTHPFSPGGSALVLYASKVPPTISVVIAEDSNGVVYMFERVTTTMPKTLMTLNDAFNRRGVSMPQSLLAYYTASGGKNAVVPPNAGAASASVLGSTPAAMASSAAAAAVPLSRVTPTPAVARATSATAPATAAGAFFPPASPPAVRRQAAVVPKNVPATTPTLSSAAVMRAGSADGSAAAVHARAEVVDVQSASGSTGSVSSADGSDADVEEDSEEEDDAARVGVKSTEETAGLLSPKQSAAVVGAVLPATPKPGVVQQRTLQMVQDELYFAQQLPAQAKEKSARVAALTAEAARLKPTSANSVRIATSSSRGVVAAMGPLSPRGVKVAPHASPKPKLSKDDGPSSAPSSAGDKAAHASMKPQPSQAGAKAHRANESAPEAAAEPSAHAPSGVASAENVAAAEIEPAVAVPSRDAATSSPPNALPPIAPVVAPQAPHAAAAAVQLAASTTGDVTTTSPALDVSRLAAVAAVDTAEKAVTSAPVGNVATMSPTLDVVAAKASLLIGITEQASTSSAAATTAIPEASVEEDWLFPKTKAIPANSTADGFVDADDADSSSSLDTTISAQWESVSKERLAAVAQSLTSREAEAAKELEGVSRDEREVRQLSIKETFDKERAALVSQCRAAEMCARNGGVLIPVRPDGTCFWQSLFAVLHASGLLAGITSSQELRDRTLQNASRLALSIFGPESEGAVLTEEQRVAFVARHVADASRSAEQPLISTAARTCSVAIKVISCYNEVTFCMYPQGKLRASMPRVSLVHHGAHFDAFVLDAMVPPTADFLQAIGSPIVGGITTASTSAAAAPSVGLGASRDMRVAGASPSTL